MEPAHRVADDDRPIDSGGVEDRDRVGDEVRGRVRGGWLHRIAVTACIGRDEPKPQAR